MGKITLRQAALWCGGRVDPIFEDVEFLGANMDSRNIEPGQLFIALEGARDGHDFIPMAMDKGAAAVLCKHAPDGVPAIIVDDPHDALGRIAHGERHRIGMKVVGITGSVGKSTTKEMVACVLEGSYKVAKTPANHNNDIGMPMAILAMPEDTELAVLEMGMNHFREIAYLTNIANPNAAVIINIGTMHIEHLGSQEGILKAKLEIAEGMAENAPLFLNGDDALLRTATQRVKQPITYFGHPQADTKVAVSDVNQTSEHLSFRVTCEKESFFIELPLEGDHYVLDAMAAISVGLAMGVSIADIQQRLASFRNLAGRQEILEEKGYTIIKDCYNAGPESMAAALRVLGAKTTRRIAVLGDMLELGVRTQAEHYRVGRIAAENADLVLAYGPNAKRVVSGALTGGMTDGCALDFEDRNQLVATLQRLAKPGDTMLFKGSHGMHMELALDKFLKEM